MVPARKMPYQLAWHLLRYNAINPEDKSIRGGIVWLDRDANEF